MSRIVGASIDGGLALLLFLTLLKESEELDAFEQLGNTILAGLTGTPGRGGAALAGEVPAIRLPAIGFDDDPDPFPMTGGGTEPDDNGVAFRRFEVGTVDQAGNFTVLWTASGLRPFTAGDMVSILTDTDLRYERFVSMLDDSTTVSGTGFADDIEVGAGNDTADLGDGNDMLRKWKPGDLAYDGGIGRDSLSFDKWTGDAAAPVRGAVVDLGAGTGRNPFGGRLTLTSVENASGTELDDRLIGNGKANALYSGKGGADTVRGGGGDDSITVDHGFSGIPPGILVDGGAGFDVLTVYGDGPAFLNRLDLTDQSNNTGVFEGGLYTGFESFVFLTPGFTFYGFDVTGTDADELFRAGPGDDTIDGGGGNDSFIEVGGADSWIGGTGRDRVDYSLFFSAVTIDLAAGTGAGGVAQGDRLDGIEDLTGSKLGDTLFGDGKGNHLDGFDGDDLLAGRAGADTLTGGLGQDTLRGDTGADLFVFTSLADSSAGRAGADTIHAFQAGLDRIDLSPIDAIPSSAADDAFTFVTGAFTAVGQVRVVVDAGTVFVELNILAGGGPEMTIRLTGGDVPVEADFIL